MPEYTLGAVESRFADIIWDNQPLSSSELAKISEKELKWKKSTSYTVLKGLCDKGLFKNENGAVTAVISKEQFSSMQSRQFVDEAFSGSLPAFLAAFSAGKRLTADEVEQLRKMVDEYGEGK